MESHRNINLVIYPIFRTNLCIQQKVLWILISIFNDFFFHLNVKESHFNDAFNPNSEGVPATHLSEGGGADSAPPLVNAVLMAQMSWNFVCDLTWVVSERFHDQKRTIMCQAPGWVQDPKIQKFQEFWNSDIF